MAPLKRKDRGAVDPLQRLAQRAERVRNRIHIFVAVSSGYNLGDASRGNVKEDKTVGDLSRDPFGDRVSAIENHRLVRVRDGAGGSAR
ncbi:MAG: hypothetical protein WBQ53_10930 [Methylocystis sp.]